MSAPIEISVVIPVRDEAENIGTLVDEIANIFGNRPAGSFEIIVVDDHSADTTRIVLEMHVLREQGVLFPANLTMGRGKDAALALGLEIARGDVIVTLDGDLENDPKDIPCLLSSLAGCDMVQGYRVSRQDHSIKKGCSYIANFIRRRITTDDIRDAGCAMRVMRKCCIEILRPYHGILFDNAHYFYPTLATIHGCPVVQIPVSHRKRIHGKSKFRLARGRVISGLRACLFVRRLKMAESKKTPSVQN